MKNRELLYADLGYPKSSQLTMANNLIHSSSKNFVTLSVWRSYLSLSTIYNQMGQSKEQMGLSSQASIKCMFNLNRASGQMNFQKLYGRTTPPSPRQLSSHHLDSSMELNPSRAQTSKPHVTKQEERSATFGRSNSFRAWYATSIREP